MNSVRPSGSRILFEVLCALVVAVSCVGAWQQVGASALLPAAAVSVLYALVRAFDLRRRNPVEAVSIQPAELAATHRSDAPTADNVVVPLVDDSPMPMVASAMEDPQSSRPTAPPAKSAKRTKSPRKAKALAAKEVEKADADKLGNDAPPPNLAPVEAVPVTPPEVVHHPHIETLFEPEPYVRMPRPAFGRKAG